MRLRLNILIPNILNPVRLFYMSLSQSRNFGPTLRQLLTYKVSHIYILPTFRLYVGSSGGLNYVEVLTGIFRKIKLDFSRKKNKT